MSAPATQAKRAAELREVMQRAGVVDRPDIRLIHCVDLAEY